MDQALENEIMRVLNELKAQVRANMEAQHINASGRTSASLRVTTDSKTYWALVGGTNGTHPISDRPDIYGSDTAPIPTLESGRNGGKVPTGFYYILREWSREKGLTFADEQERNTFAYFLARKIAREGTKRHETPASVYSEPARTAADELREILKNATAQTIAAAFGKITTLRGAF